MSTVDEEEFVRKLEPFGRKAREVWMPSGTPWGRLHLQTRVGWSRIADAVLTEYDPEWPSVRAGL